MVTASVRRQAPARLVLLASLLGLSVFVIALSLVLGTSPEYVAAQATFSVLMVVIAAASRGLPLVVNAIIAMFLIKNFALSQLVKIILLQPAHEGLAAPVATAFAITVAAGGVAIGYLISKLFYRGKSRKGFCPSATSLSRPALVGYILSGIGLVCKVGATVTILGGSASALFFYMAELTFVGVSALIVSNMRRTGNRRVWSWSTILILLVYMAFAAPSASKFDILKAPIFVALVYISLRKLPPLMTTLLGVASLLFVVFIAHPIINHARAVGGNSGLSTTEAYVSAVANVISNPATLTEYNDESTDMEARWITRLYYGKPAGFIGRFTPNQVDDMIVRGPSALSDPLSYIAGSLSAAVPAALGLQRNSEVGQAGLEGLGATSFRSQLTSTNIGLVGEFYVLAGLTGVFLGFALVTVALTLFYWVLFGTHRREILSVGFAIPFLLVLADGNLATFSTLSTQSWLLMAILLKLVALLTQPGRRPHRALERPLEERRRSDDALSVSRSTDGASAGHLGGR